VVEDSNMVERSEEDDAPALGPRTEPTTGRRQEAVLDAYDEEGAAYADTEDERELEAVLSEAARTAARERASCHGNRSTDS
jgi:hypothetical protein